MKIEKNKVVGIHYTLKDNEGNVIDTSEGREPLNYLHGRGNLIPGLEDELKGKALNDNIKVSIEPEKAYGQYEKDMVFEVGRSSFSDPDKIEVGMQVQGQIAEGESPRLLTVIEIKDDKVILDANHPLAGQTLNFDVQVVELRDATKEEIDHGHVHGPEGHQH
jgi:FKBP-type peptidyl-prolyl cis-trans isomerase SlyD